MSLVEVMFVRTGIPCDMKTCKFMLFCVSIYRHNKVSKLQVDNKVPAEAGSCSKLSISKLPTRAGGASHVSL